MCFKVAHGHAGFLPLPTGLSIPEVPALLLQDRISGVNRFKTRGQLRQSVFDWGTDDIAILSQELVDFACD